MHMKRRVLNMIIDGYVVSGRSKIRWMDCVEDDISRKGESMAESLIGILEEDDTDSHCALLVCTSTTSHIFFNMYMNTRPLM